MKKVVKFRLNRKDGWYRAGRLEMCATPTKEFLGVGREFEMHVSTNPPSHDEYYVIERGDIRWCFADGRDAGRSPWMSRIDDWLDTHFGKRAGTKLYAWAMG